MEKMVPGGPGPLGVTTIEEKRVAAFGRPDPMPFIDPSTPKPLKIKARVDDREHANIPEYIGEAGVRWIVLEIKGCDRGPPLMMTEDGSWVPREDACATLATFLTSLQQLSGTSIRSEPDIDGRKLPRYQCAVRKEVWKELWDAVREPFIAMRSAYRFLRGGKNAPSLWFGQNPRFLDEHWASSPIASPTSDMSDCPNSAATEPGLLNPFSAKRTFRSLAARGYDVDSPPLTPLPLTPVVLQYRAGFVHFRPEMPMRKRARSAPPKVSVPL